MQNKWNKTRTYRGYVIESVGGSWRVWTNYVEESYQQRRFNTLKAARAFISKIEGGLVY